MTYLDSSYWKERSFCPAEYGGMFDNQSVHSAPNQKFIHKDPTHGTVLQKNTKIYKNV